MRLKHKAGAMAALAALLLAGCNAGPTYKKPQTAAEPTFLNATPQAYGAGEPLGEFWTQFNDPMLNELVAEGIAANNDVKVAVARLKEERALRTQVKLDKFPTVTSEADWTKSKLSTDQGQGFPGNLLQNELYNAGFDAYWEIDFFGRVRRLNQAANAATEAAAYDVQAVLITVTSEIARNYLEMRGLQAQLRVAEQNAENQANTLEITEARLEAGRGTEFDTERAKAQLSQTRAILPAIKAQIAAAQNRIAVLVGKTPSAMAAEFSKPGALPPMPEKIDVSSPEAMLRRRPDIASAERHLAEQTAMVGVAVADLFPRVVFSGQFSLNANEFTGLGGAGSSSYAFGPSVTWPAFNIGRVKARIRASEAREDQALAAYQQTVLLAIEETETALVALEQSRARSEQLAKAATASKNAAELAQIRFEGGLSDFLAVLDAQRAELLAEDQLAESRTQTASLTIRLYKALGAGFVPGTPNTTANQTATRTQQP